MEVALPTVYFFQILSFAPYTNLVDGLPSINETGFTSFEYFLFKRWKKETEKKREEKSEKEDRKMFNPLGRRFAGIWLM